MPVSSIAFAILISIFWWHMKSAPTLSSVAVLKFENASGDEALDYLSLALPDELATLLTKSRDLSVRPFGYVGEKDSLVTKCPSKYTAKASSGSA